LAEQQCGHGILHLPSSEGLLYPNHPPAGKLARNLTEPFHQPLRRRERKMQRFKAPGSTQQFVSMYAATYNTFNLQRHLISRRTPHTFWA
jgi:putative transposase